MTRKSSYSDDAPSEKLLEDQAKHSFEQNQQAVAEVIKVRDGKLFGLIPVPPELTRGVNVLLGPVTSYLSDSAADFVYTQTKSLAENKFFEKNFQTSIHANSSKIGKYAGVAALWSIIALRPVSEFIGHNKTYAVKRLAFAKEIKALCEATGADYQHNEVIKAATTSMNEGWYTDMKSLLPGLITFAIQTPFALKTHNEFLKSHAADILKDSKKATLIAKGIKPEDAARKAAEEQEDEIIRRTNEARKKFFAKSKHYDHESDRGEAAFQNYLKVAHRDLHEGNAETSTHDIKATELLLNKNTLIGAVGFVSEDIERSMDAAAQKKKGKHNSYEMIQALASEMQGEQNPREVHRAVVEIFQQLEEDMGRAKFAGGLLDKLNDSTKVIAEMISDGRMDALSLAKLAGEHKVIKHSADGKRTFLSEKEIEASVQELLGAKVGHSDETSAADFIAKFANPLLAKETIKKDLCALEGEERNLLIAVTPEDTLKQAGLKQAEISERRRAGYAKLYDQIGAGVLHIAALDPKLLKSYGVSEEEIQHIQELSQQILAGDMEQLKVEVDRRSTLLTDVAQVTLNEQIKGKNSWQERIAEAKSLKEKLAETLAEGPENPAEMAMAGAKPADSKLSGEELRRAQAASVGDEGVMR